MATRERWGLEGEEGEEEGAVSLVACCCMAGKSRKIRHLYLLTASEMYLTDGSARELSKANEI